MNHIIDATFCNIERFDRYITLQSLYTAFGHQVEDGLTRQQESDRMRLIVGKLWDLKLQIHMLENECATDDIGRVISLMLDLYLEDIIPRPPSVCVCMHLR